MGNDSGRLPIKTKIAVWWIIAAGLLGTIGGIMAFTNHDWKISGDIGDAIASYVVILVVIFLFGFFYVLAGIILAAKKQGAWIAAVIILSFHLIGYIILLLLPWILSGGYIAIPICILFVLFVPFVLIILDVKNYWRVAEYVTAMKNAKSPAGEITSHPNSDL